MIWYVTSEVAESVGSTQTRASTNLRNDPKPYLSVVILIVFADREAFATIVLMMLFAFGSDKYIPKMGGVAINFCAFNRCTLVIRRSSCSTVLPRITMLRHRIRCLHHQKWKMRHEK